MRDAEQHKFVGAHAKRAGEAAAGGGHLIKIRGLRCLSGGSP
jgi:hypothetical protein